ncbi:30S ribosomal protein S7 [Thermoplasmatota archaeon]
MAVKKSEGKNIHFFPILAKYDKDKIKVEDKGLERYINLDSENIYLGAIFANKMFSKPKVPVVERLINNLMRTEKYNGKKVSSYKVVKSAFEVIEKRTKSNPIQVLINAIEHAAPKEETTRLRFGGISVPKAVDTAPQRRLDIALRNICKGVVNSAHKNKKSVTLCLADELIKASKNDPSSFAVAKKNDMERVAKSAR